MSNDVEPVDIPRYVDNPPQILFLEMDDLAPLMFGFLVGTTLHYMHIRGLAMPLSLIGGGFLSYFYVKYKREALPGALFHMVYCKFPLSLNKRFKNGLIKRFDN